MTAFGRPPGGIQKDLLRRTDKRFIRKYRISDGHTNFTVEKRTDKAHVLNLPLSKVVNTCVIA